jgi:hypothetical protein
MKHYPYLEIKLRQIEKELAASLELGQEQDGGMTEQEAKVMIRNKALEVYKFGIAYVCKFFNVKPFYEVGDFAPIGKITDDVYRIWVYGGRLDSALISLTSITLAKAIKSKSLQIVSNPQYYMLTAKVVRPKVATPRPVVKSVTLPPIEEDFTSDITDNTDIVSIDNVDTTSDNTDSTDNQLHSLMVWVTENDALVCTLYCEPLEGKTWEIDDPDIPEPVNDTHPNCRCRLELQNQEDLMS